MSGRILAVEDTPALRALLQLCLTRAGYEVELAEDGLSAVELFRAGAYDAVVMDIQMPVMDGLAAAALMREWERRQRRAPTPLLALTANSEPADLRKCLEAGFTETLRKPFSRADLLAAIATALGPAADGRIVVTADPEFADLIPQFLDNCRREAAAMGEALKRRDFAAIVAASHKLKGAGASFGFQPLSENARLLETAAKAADGEGALRHLEEMRLYLEKVDVVYP